MIYYGVFEQQKSILTPCEKCKMKYMKLLRLVRTQQYKRITACTLPKYKVYVLYSNIKLVDLIGGICLTGP